MAEKTTQALAKLEMPSMAELSEIKGISQVFVASGMFDDVKDASQAFVKILKGRELGLQPVTAMESFDIIQKRLFIKPKTIGALINSCGYGAYTTLERTPERCVIRFSRRTHEGWVDLPDIEYTIEIAQAAGLVQRSPQWKADPANMLFWRCLGRGGSQYFPELLNGMEVAHVVETISQQEALDIEEKGKAARDALFGEDRPRTVYEREQAPAEPTPDHRIPVKAALVDECNRLGLDLDVVLEMLVAQFGLAYDEWPVALWEQALEAVGSNPERFTTGEVDLEDGPNLFEQEVDEQLKGE